MTGAKVAGFRDKEKGVDAYASELARISRTVPENIDELTSELEFDEDDGYGDGGRILQSKPFKFFTSR